MDTFDHIFKELNQMMASGLLPLRSRSAEEVLLESIIGIASEILDHLKYGEGRESIALMLLRDDKDPQWLQRIEKQLELTRSAIEINLEDHA